MERVPIFNQRSATIRAMLALARRFFAGRPVAQAVAVFAALNLLTLLIFTLLVPSRPIVLPVEVPFLQPREVALRVGLALALYACVLWALRPGRRRFWEFLLLGGVGVATVWMLTQYYLPFLALGLVPVVARYWLSLPWTLSIVAALIGLSGWWSLREPLQLTLEVTFTQGPGGAVSWSALPQGTDYPNIETSFFVFMAMLFAGYSLFALEVLVRESQARMALESTQRKLEEKSRQAGVLEERQRLAREIHDTLAQNFTSIVMHLEAAEALFSEQSSEAVIASEPTPVAVKGRQAPGDAGTQVKPLQASQGVAKAEGRRIEDLAPGRLPETAPLKQVRAYLDQARSTAREGLSEARRMVWALRPEVLEGASLPQALERVAQRWAEKSGVRTEFTLTGEPQPLHPALEVSLLRVTQEALANVRKHAQARWVSLTLSYLDDLVLLDIQDDGVGLQTGVSSPDGGFGLRSIRERVEALGGHCTIESERGVGTTVAVSLPVAPAWQSPGRAGPESRKS